MSNELKLNPVVMEANENPAARNYWKKRLRDIEFRPYFTGRRGHADTNPENRYAVNRSDVPETTLRDLHAIAPAATSKHILLLSCLSILLHRYSSFPDIVIFTPTYIADPASEENNAVFPVRVTHFENISFRNFIMELKYNLVQDLSHSNFRLEKMLQMDQQTLAGLPIIGMVVGQVQQESLLDALSPEMIFSFDIGRYPSLSIRYDPQKFDAAYVSGVAKHYFDLLANLMRDKERDISEVDMITEQDKLAIINEVADYPDELVASRESIPASYHQERLWFIDQFESGYLYEGGPVYHNIPFTIDLQGELDEGLLEQGIELLLRRHDALRTTIVSTADGLIQKIVPMGEFGFSMQRVDAESHNIGSLVDEEIDIPFQLDRQLIRAVLFRLPESRYKLILLIHHIVADRSSTTLLARELFSAYEKLSTGEPITEQRAKVQYSGFSLWQRESLKKMEMNMLSYWRSRLGGKLKVLRLTSDQTRAAVHTYTRGVNDVLLPAGLVRRLLEYDKTLQAGAGIILMAAFKILLYKYSQQEEIVIGTSIDNRCHAFLSDTVGPIDNLMVMRSYIQQDMSFTDFVKVLSLQYQTSARHGLMPFDKLVSELNPEKDMSRTALFDVLFQYSDGIAGFPVIQGLHVSGPDTNLGYGKYDLNLFLQGQEGVIQGKMVFNSGYYHTSMITTMTAHYCELLNQLLSGPDGRLSTVNFLNDAERTDILREYDLTHIGYPEDKSITDLFCEQVRRWPQNIALQFEDRSVTYAELDDISTRLAFRLRDAGVLPGSVVGLLMDRSVHTIAGILAILKAGGAYLPIDCDYPSERIAYFLRDSGAAIVLTLVAYKEKVGNAATVICSDLPAESESAIAELGPVSPSGLCYVIYTSGTTGNPKGVMIEHKNVVRLFFNDTPRFSFGPGDVWTMFHSHCFDFSVWEIFGALLFGGKLVIVPKMIARDTPAYLSLLKDQGVTILNQTPGSFYNVMREELASEEKLLKLKYVIFGGEALSPGKLKQWRMKYPNTRLINMYGITETTVHVTYKEISDQDIANNVSNIGKPIPTLSVYILDGHLRPVPRGVIGELFIGGAGVARGYLGNRALTESRFIEDPFKPGEIVYRSGDLVKRMISGDLEFMGRIDHQVQLRGFRIELGEIESHLALHNEIEDAAVVLKERNGDRFLVAYYVSDRVFRTSDLRTYLLDKLPDHMIPSYFVHLEKMPLTQNGKLDRDGLPQPEIELNDEYVAPVNETEVQLVEIWAEVLGVDKSVIGGNSNFFELGGHSLLAPIVISLISDRLLKKSHIKALYQYPTVKALSEFLMNM